MEAPRPCGQVWPHHRSFVQGGRLQRQPPGTVPGRGGEHGSRAWPCRHDGDKKSLSFQGWLTREPPPLPNVYSRAKEARLRGPMTINRSEAPNRSDSASGGHWAMSVDICHI